MRKVCQKLKEADSLALYESLSVNAKFLKEMESIIPMKTGLISKWSYIIADLKKVWVFWIKVQKREGGKKGWERERIHTATVHAWHHEDPSFISDITQSPTNIIGCGPDGYQHQEAKVVYY